MHTRVPFSWVSLAAAAVSAVSFSHFHGNRKRTCVALHGFTSSTAVITMFLSLCDLPFRQMVCVCVYLFVLVHLLFWYCFRTGGGLTVMIRSRESLLLAPVPRHLTSSSSASCIEDRFVSAQRGTHSAACVGLPDCRTTGSKYSAAEVAAVSYWRQPSALSRCRSACTLLAVLLFLSL